MSNKVVGILLVNDGSFTFNGFGITTGQVRSEGNIIPPVHIGFPLSGAILTFSGRYNNIIGKELSLKSGHVGVTDVVLTFANPNGGDITITAPVTLEQKDNLDAGHIFFNPN